MHAKRTRVISPICFDNRTLTRPRPAAACGVQASGGNPPTPRIEDQVVCRVRKANSVDRLQALEVVVKTIGKNPKGDAPLLAPAEQSARAHVEFDPRQERLQTLGAKLEPVEEFDGVLPSRKPTLGVALLQIGARLGQVLLGQGGPHIALGEGAVEIAKDRQTTGARIRPEAGGRRAHRGEAPRASSGKESGKGWGKEWGKGWG